MTRIAFIGPIGVGKSTAARYLEEAHGFIRLSFAALLRTAVETLNPIVHAESGLRYRDVVGKHGYDQAKALFPEVRRLLQAMGTEVGRDLFGEDFWVEQFARGEQAFPRHAGLVVDDARFTNELRYLRSRGFKVVRLYSDRTPDPRPHTSHASEREWLSFPYDAHIDTASELQTQLAIDHMLESWS